MMTRLKDLVAEFLPGVPFIVTWASKDRAEWVLLFPLGKEQVEEFSNILHRGTTPGFLWEAKVLPSVLSRMSLKTVGSWTALSVLRKPLGAPEQAERYCVAR